MGFASEDRHSPRVAPLSKRMRHLVLTGAADSRLLDARSLHFRVPPYSPLALDSPEASDFVNGAAVRVTLSDGEPFWLHDAAIRYAGVSGLESPDTSRTIDLADVWLIEMKKPGAACPLWARLAKRSIRKYSCPGIAGRARLPHVERL